MRVKVLDALKNDFNVQLKRQIGFIERSAALFDEGYLDEAIRIAVSVRTLIHQTRNSTSLLSHLSVEDIRLVSSYQKVVVGSVSTSVFGMGKVDGRNRFIPLISPLEPPVFLSVDDWWNEEVILVSGMHWYRRKDLVLSAADKDGGAHVDEQLPRIYGALTNDGNLGVDVWEDEHGDLEIKPISNGHLFCLRQIAFELLNSPELFSIKSLLDDD